MPCDPGVSVLADWKKRPGGVGRIIQPLRRDGLQIDRHTPGVYLAEALEKLKEILGHDSVVMTERYAHLWP